MQSWRSGTHGAASTLGAAQRAHTGTGVTLQSRETLTSNKATWKQPNGDPKTEPLRPPTRGWCVAKAREPVPRGGTGIVAQGWRGWHGMLGEDAALGILSVESRKNWGRRGTLAIFSHFWLIIFEVSFAGNTFDCDILRQNSEGARTSPSLEVLDGALDNPV